MARPTGTFEFPSNFEVTKAGPIDARSVTPLACELTNSSLPFTYLGMLVSVTEDLSANNGLYMLSAADDTNVDNWQRIGTGGSISSGVQTFSAGDGLLDNGTSTDPNIAVDSTVVRTIGAQCIAGDKDFSGNILSGGSNLNALFSNCQGTIEGVTTGPYLTGGGTSGCITIGIDSACAAAWDNASVGGVSNVTGGDGITSTGGTTPEIAVDSTVIRTIGNQQICGNVHFTGGACVNATTLSAVNRVEGSNISTLENKVEGLYSYLVNNFDTNQITDATDLTDFVTNYPKTGLEPGDVITLSAINTAYILGDNDGSSNSDWLEVNLKPNFLFYRSNLTDYATLDCVALSAAKSSKYIIQVEDTSTNDIFYGEINVVSNGTVAVATEYALNYTTFDPFVEFGAEVVGGRVCLSAVALGGSNMANFTFKGNRTNLFG